MTDVYTHTQLFLKTPKKGVLIGQMGSFFNVHVLPRIYITTEHPRSDSSLVSAQQTQTPKFILIHSEKTQKDAAQKPTKCHHMADESTRSFPKSI